MTFRRFVFPFALSFVVGSFACSSSDDDGPSPLTADPSSQSHEDGGSTGSPDPGRSTDAGSDAASNPPTPPPCDEKQMAAVQAVMDAAHDPAKTDMVATVKTPSCGVRFFTSGPNKIDADRLQRIGSVSKTYTGGVVLDLVHEGLLSLDDPAARWLSGVPGGNAILVRHLLQHTSGLPSCEGTNSPDQRLAACFQKPLASQPGAKFAYQNINFLALGRIAEKVTGKELATLIHERLTNDIGASHTFFESGETITGDIAPVRAYDGTSAAYAYPAIATWGAGNVVATSGDVVKWIEVLGNGSFLGTLDATAKTTIDIAEGTYAAKYGLGIIELPASTTMGGGVAYGHFGDLLSQSSVFTPLVGYHTAAFYFPEKDTTIVAVLDYTPLTSLNGDDETLSKLIRGPFYSVLGALFGGAS